MAPDLSSSDDPGVTMFPKRVFVSLVIPDVVGVVRSVDETVGMMLVERLIEVERKTVDSIRLEK